MSNFQFNSKVTSKIIEEIKNATKYIKIAIFQLHSVNIFNALDEKIRKGVKVEIITLPYDSINENIRNDVVEQFEKIKKSGAKIFFNKWNVGDPERTSTSIGQWYAFHGKFIVTDKSAIVMSANFTENEELDAILIFQDKDKIDEFDKKFDELKINFIADNGNILRNLIKKSDENSKALFELPRVIETKIHKDYWVRHYPVKIISNQILRDNQLYISPFDVQARYCYESVINNAGKYVFISSESFTDPDFANYLIKIRLNGIKVKILTAAVSMDFTDRINKMLKNMIANGIEIRSTDLPLHGKILITDKKVVVSSINLNKMNLGFYQTRKYWRANTETFYIDNHKNIINNAYKQYLLIFDNSVDVKDKLSEKIEKTISTLLSDVFNIKSKGEVKNLFAKLILLHEIETDKIAYKIGKIASKLIIISNKKILEIEDFTNAVILYYLSERKQDFSELKEKLFMLSHKIKLNNSIKWLTEHQFIEKINDYYKIKLEKLIS